MAFPRILQRLFVNSGAGPKLRHDIIPWDEEKSLVALEAWRQAMIGTSMPMTSTTLPAGFMWADGSFAAFAAYPELKAKYDAGGFAGMLLAYNASEADIAAYPGKFKPDAANPTGLFLPRLEGLFARYCASSGGGKYNKPGAPNISGSCCIGFTNGQQGTFYHSGAISAAGYVVGMFGGGSIHDPTAGHQGGIKLNAAASSAVYGASATIMPASVETPLALYLGRAAEV